MYKIKKEAKWQIKNNYIVEKLGLCKSHVSLLLNGKRLCPKITAYAIASLYGKEIKDLFEEVGGK